MTRWGPAGTREWGTSSVLLLGAEVAEAIALCGVDS